MIIFAGLAGVTLFLFPFLGQESTGFFSFLAADLGLLPLAARRGSLEDINVGRTGPCCGVLMLGGGIDGWKSGGNGTVTSFFAIG